MDSKTNDSLQLAELWVKLRSLQEEIDNHILPVAHHLGVVKEDDELYIALEVCSEQIRGHFDRFKLRAESKNDPLVDLTSHSPAIRIREKPHHFTEEPMDVHCGACGEPWEVHHLWEFAIFEIGLTVEEALAWQKLPPGEKLNQRYREKFKEAGWEFGRSVLNVIRCPCCPEGSEANPENVEIKAVLEDYGL